MHRDLSLAAILIVRVRDGEGGSGLDEAGRSDKAHDSARAYAGPRFVLETGKHVQVCPHGVICTPSAA
jgi:hypothetical protein